MMNTLVSSNPPCRTSTKNAVLVLLLIFLVRLFIVCYMYMFLVISIDAQDLLIK